jgi:L-fuculose-phosphate aldolase
LPQAFIDAVARSDGEGFLGFWEAAVRAELAADPALLDT